MSQLVLALESSQGKYQLYTYELLMQQVAKECCYAAKLLTYYITSQKCMQLLKLNTLCRKG